MQFRVESLGSAARATVPSVGALPGLPQWLSNQVQGMWVQPPVGRSPEGEVVPTPYSCLESPVDRGARRLQPTWSQESDTIQPLNNSNSSWSVPPGSGHREAGPGLRAPGSLP